MSRDTVDADQILRHTPWVRALARRLLSGDEHRADDVVQDAWIAALDAQPAPHALRKWLATTVRNLSHHVRRSETRRLARERTVARDESQAPAADLVARTELHRELLRHVLDLGEPHRTTLLLRYVEDLPPRAIARRCDISPAAARTRLRRAHASLRANLDRNWQGEAADWRAGLAALTGASSAPTWIGAVMAGKQTTAVIGGLVLALAAGLFWWSQRDDDNTRTTRRTAAGAANDEARTGTRGSDDDAAATTKTQDGAADTTSNEKPDDGSIAPADSAFRVTGKITWAGRAPRRARVLVYASRVGDNKLGALWSDDTGAFATPLPEAGRFAVEVIDEGTVLRRRFQVSEDAPVATLTFEFGAGAVLAGQVHNTYGSLDEDVHGTFRPAGQEDLEVRVVSRDDPKRELPFSRVDARGRYRIAGLPAGGYWVVVPTKFHIEKLELEADAVVEHNLRLATGRIEGAVRDKTSGGPAGPWVQVVVGLVASEDNREQLFKAAGLHRVSARCAPDEDGRYVFANLPAGEYAMFANGGAYGLHRAGATLKAPDLTALVDFDMEKGSVLDTTITDPNGKPLMPMMIWSQGIRWGFQGPASGLKSGTFDVSVWGAGHAIETRRNVVFKPGETTKIKFALAPAAETTVRFRDDRGRPVSGVRVSVMAGGRDVQQLMQLVYPGEPMRVTGADGRIVIRGVAPGGCRLVAKMSGFAAVDAALRLAADKPEIEWKLEPAETKFEWRLRINRVAPGGAAAQAGLQPGDVLLRYDGKELATLRDLRAALAAAKASGRAEVAIAYERAGAPHEVRAAAGTLGVGVEEFEVKPD